MGGSNITKLDIAEYENEANHEREKQLRRMKKAEKPVVKYKKTPDSDILKKMKLKYGKNVGKFQLDVGDGNK